MKKTTKILVLCFALTIISGIGYLKVSALNDNEATVSQTQQIRNNCITLKNTLNQLHISDALLRVNMGQRYELMSTKLMDRFNSRVSSNNLKVDQLATASVNYRSTLDVFRLDYQSYEENMTTTIKIDCQSDPSAFYNSLLSTRNRRMQVYTDVKKLNLEIDQYRLAVSQLEKDYQASGGK